MTYQRFAPACLLLLALAVFVGCGDNGDDDSRTETPTAAASVVSTSATTPVEPVATEEPPGTAVGSPTLSEGNEFTNTEFGYRLRYPESFTVADAFSPGSSSRVLQDQTISSDGSSNALSLPAGEAIIGVRVAHNPEGVLLDAWAANGGTESAEERVLSVVEFQIAGQRGVQSTVSPGIEGPRVDQVITYVARGDRVYSIQMLSGSVDAAADHQDALDFIVSTFEFIE